MQRYERTRFYDEPIHCVFCGQRVSWSGDDPGIDACDHTVFIADDVGFHVLSADAAEQLRRKGVAVERNDEDIDVESDLSPEELTDGLEFPDGLKIASYSGPPGRFGFYVGFAPRDQD